MTRHQTRRRLDTGIDDVVGRELSNIVRESGLSLAENSLVLRRGDEADAGAASVESSSTTNLEVRGWHRPYSVEIGTSISREIKVDDKVDGGDIDATGEEVCGDEDSLLGLDELVELLESSLRTHAAMNAFRRERILQQHRVQCLRSEIVLDVDDHLSEVIVIQNGDQS